MRLAAVALVLTLAACAEQSSVGGDPSPSPTTTYAADDVVLRVTNEGGLMPAGAAPVVPFWSLMGDGRVFTLGPQPEIYPGPAFPNVRVATVSAATVRRIVAAAREAGVDGKQRDYGDPPIADAATASFRLATETGTVETRVYALLEDTTVTNDARRKLRELVNHLTDLNGWLGAGTETKDETYVPTAVAIYARPYQPDTQSGITAQEIAWTGPDPAAGDRTDAGTCTVLTGNVLAKVLDDLKRSNQLTRWTYGGKDWAFTIRPLLPDERTCPAVG